MWLLAICRLCWKPCKAWHKEPFSLSPQMIPYPWEESFRFCLDQRSAEQIKRLGLESRSENSGFCCLFFFFNKPDILSLLPCSFPPLIGQFGITTPVNYSSQPAFAKVAAHVMNSPNLPDLALSGCKLAICKNRGSADERWPQHFLLQTVSG